MNRQIFEYHPVIGYRYIPNLKIRIPHESGGYLIKTNAEGFRSELEFDRQIKPGVKRILLFGDSYTAADGVSNKSRFSDLLMRMIPNTEFYNFGLPGTGTDQQYLIWKEFAKDIDHDLVMIVVLVENIRRIVSSYRCYLNSDNEKILFQKPYFKLLNDQLTLHNVPVNPKELKPSDLSAEEKSVIDVGGRFPLLRRIINKSGLKNIAQRIIRYQPLPEYKKNGSEWLLMKHILRTWHSEMVKPVLIVHLPLHQYVEEESDYTAVEKRFNELRDLENVTVFNPLENLLKYPKEERRNFRFVHDAHPTQAGHKAYAEAFAPVLRNILHL